jgi:hypothetical protein
MKYIFAAVCLTCSVAPAQVQEYERKLTCGKTQFVLTALSKKAKESPVWVGYDPATGTNTAIMVNPETLSWTVVQYDKDMACVLDSGEGFSVLTEAPKESY